MEINRNIISGYYNKKSQNIGCESVNELIGILKKMEVKQFPRGMQWPI